MSNARAFAATGINAAFVQDPRGVWPHCLPIVHPKITGVLPAYNAAQTLKQTVNEISNDIVDDVILVDDASVDATVELARKLGILTTIRHDRNRGYGGNQKICCTAALARDADTVVMLHPDYRYSPKLVTAMGSMIASGSSTSGFPRSWPRGARCRDAGL